MQGSNKFLFGIVVGIVLLVVITLFVVMQRPEATYQDNNTPEGVAHNYLLALQQQDYEHAYSYLPTKYPYPQDAAAMAEDIDDNPWQFDADNDFSLAVESTNMRNAEQAVVTIRKTSFYNNGLLGSGQSTQTFKLNVQLEDGNWKIFKGDQYWSNCWGYSQEKWCQ